MAPIEIGMLAADLHSKRKAEKADEAGPPPPLLRRNYTVCGLLHDRSQEARDRQLSEMLGYKFAVVDVTDGTVRECSASLAAALGVPVHRLCGQRLSDWVVGDADAAAVQGALDRREALSMPLAMRGEGGASGVRGELNMPVDDVRLGDARAWRFCLVLDTAGDGGASIAELHLDRLATCLQLAVPLAPSLRLALDKLQRTFLVTNPALEDNPIVFASEAFCEMTGYERAELVGRNCRLLQGPGTDLSVVRQVRAAVRNGCECTAELLNYKRDGTAFTNLLHFAPVRDPTGGVAYFVGVQTNLTELRASPLSTEAALGVARGALPPCVQQVGVPLPREVRDAACSVDSALSQHLREILRSSVLMQSLG